MLKRVLQILLVLCILLLLMLGGVMLVLQFPSVQTYLAKKATAFLGSRLNTTISIDKLRVVYPDEIDLVDFYMSDLKGDTLIYAHHFRVDFSAIQLLKKKVEVNTIKLEDAYVRLARDSSGQGTNIAQIFSSPGTKTNSDTAKTPLTWKLDLNRISLNNIRFLYDDFKGKMKLSVVVSGLEADVKEFDLQKKFVGLNELAIDGADVRIVKPKRLPSPEDTSKMDVHFLKGIMQVEWNKFSLTNSHFSLNDWNADTIKARGMDFKHIDVQDINLHIANGAIIEDTIFADIKSLQAKERCGLQVIQLTTKARVSVNDITCENLLLRTPNSTVKDFFAMRYEHFREFKKFLTGVKLEARLNDTKFALKDLGYFVKNMEKVEHNVFSISGKINGAVSSIDGHKLQIYTGNNTQFVGDFSTSGLPNLFETSLNVRVKKLTTTAADIYRIYPFIKLPVNLNTLGLVSYSGSFDGFITDFVSNGKLLTQIGSATTDVNFTYDRERNKSAYKGSLNLQKFDLGKYFYDEKNLGTVSLQTKIKGGGLTLESLRAELQGKVQEITLINHSYKNIDLDGFVVKKSFNGAFHLDDESLKMDFNGKVDLSKSIPEFRFVADVKRASFKDLNLTKSDFRFKGEIKADFAGLKVDEIIGRVDMNNVVMQRDTVEVFINYSSVDVTTLGGNKKLFVIKSDFMEGEIDGNFNYKDLPKAMVRFAKSTFTRDYTDTVIIADQDFHFDIRIFEPKDFTRIIHPDFTLIRNTHIEGDFVSNKNIISLTGFIPELQYGKFNARRIEIDASAESGYFNFQTSVDKVFNGDSLWIDTLLLTTQTTETKDFRFDLLLADKLKYNYANLIAYITPLKDRTLIKLEPGDFKLANYNWHFDRGNYIYVQGKKITSNGLVFRSAEQKIFIDAYLKDDTATALKLTLDNTSISDFTGIFTTKVRDLSGSINGKLIVEDVFYKPRVFADFVVNDFYLGNQLIGDVNIESRLDERGKNILVYASVKSVNNFLEARGYVSLDPTNPGMKIDVDAPRLGLNFLNYRFFDRYVKNVKGYALVRATVYGTPAKPLLGGYVTLVDDTVTVSFLNTTYHLHNQTVKLDSKGFDFGNLNAFDIRNNLLLASGRINHESFKKWEIACEVVSENAQFLNTTEKLSPYFYGVVFGKGKVTFKGPINSPVINAFASTLPGSYCRLPIRSSYETNRYSFYRFASPKDSVSAVPKNQLKLNGVSFTLDLDVTPDARMDIILDPVTGDILTGYGRGNLKIELPKVGDISMYGTYEIERGNYLFTLQNIINKRFEITRGGTINFSGSIYKAGLNVDAVYEVRTSMTDLINDLISEGGGTPQNQLAAAARARVPTRLALKLTGVLEKPTIAFDIKAIDPDPAIKSYVEQKLAMLKTNDNEMNKQVFGILVMNRFLPQSPFGSAVANSNIGGTAANTVSEFLSSQLTNYLTSLLGYANVNNLDINIDYRQYDQLTSTNTGTGNANATNATRRELQLELSQRFLNNRLSINAGGNLDFGNSQVVQGGTTARNVIPTGDFQIEYSLTKDGVWRAKAFNRTNYDYYNSRNNNRTGLGISYRKEFDKPSELFVKKDKKKKEKKKK